MTATEQSKSAGSKMREKSPTIGSIVISFALGYISLAKWNIFVKKWLPFDKTKASTEPITGDFSLIFDPTDLLCSVTVISHLIFYCRCWRKMRSCTIFIFDVPEQNIRIRFVIPECCFDIVIFDYCFDTNFFDCRFDCWLRQSMLLSFKLDELRYELTCFGIVISIFWISLGDLLQKKRALLRAQWAFLWFDLLRDLYLDILNISL